MKYAILILSFLLVFTTLFAQGNLQFNKVVFIEADTTISCVQAGVCVDSFLIRDIIIPAGKVLKIESININPNGGNFYALYLNALPILNQFMNFPIWLPTGSYKLKWYGLNNPSGSNFTQSYIYQISGIEFNIVQ